MESTLFYMLAAFLIYFSLKVVTTKNLFHSVMSAFVVLMSTAGLFFLMNAKFLGMVQVLIYAGAVTILVIFVVMLTTAGSEYKIAWEKRPSPVSFIFVLVFGGLLAFVILSIEWPIADRDSLTNVTEILAIRLFTEYILAFEVASIVLLAALVGAIVLARRD